MQILFVANSLVTWLQIGVKLFFGGTCIKAWFQILASVYPAKSIICPWPPGPSSFSSRNASWINGTCPGSHCWINGNIRILNWRGSYKIWLNRWYSMVQSIFGSWNDHWCIGADISDGYCLASLVAAARDPGLFRKLLQTARARNAPSPKPTWHVLGILRGCRGSNYYPRGGTATYHLVI